MNIYLNELDHFVKHDLRVRSYLRYSDDFVVLSHDRDYLAALVSPLRVFLLTRLHLLMHDAVCLRTIASGVDFLGWVHFSDHRVLRTTTKRRALRNCEGRSGDDPVVQSYLGLLSHGNARDSERQIHARAKQALRDTIVI